jgi:hypothetical protein
VRAKVVKEPEDYVWTGHLSYLGRGGGDLIDEEFVLDQFSGKRALGRRRYRQFVREGISGGHEEKYYRVKDQRYLGEESFVERIETERKGPQGWVYEVSLGAISEEASIALGIARDRLYSTTRDREGARGRGVGGYLARRISGYGVEEIAAHFGRSPQTMSEGIKKVEDLQRRDKLFAKRLSFMLENVVKRGKRRYRITEA